MTKSGAGYSKPPTTRLYNELMFLKDIFTNRNTSSNVSVAKTPLQTLPVNDNSLNAENFDETIQPLSPPDEQSLSSTKKGKRSNQENNEIDQMLINAFNRTI